MMAISILLFIPCHVSEKPTGHHVGFPELQEVMTIFAPQDDLDKLGITVP